MDLLKLLTAKHGIQAVNNYAVSHVCSILEALIRLAIGLTVLVLSLGAMGGVYHYHSDHACADATDKVRRHFLEPVTNVMTCKQANLKQ